MPQEDTSFDLRSILRFPLEGEEWSNRLVTGSLLNLAAYFIPIIPLVFVFGYLVLLMRRAIEGQKLCLPQWNDWSKLFVDGLRALLVALVYLLPGILVLFGGWALYFVASIIFPLMAGFAGQDNGVALALGVTFGVFGSMAILMLSMFLGMFLILLAFIPLPVALAHFVAKDEVAAAFHVRDWWPILKQNAIGYFGAWVVVLGLATIVGIVVNLVYLTIVLCCLLPLLAAPLSFYGSLVSAAIFGQAYRDGAALAKDAPVPSTNE
jgi:hypothetical protein